MFYLKEKDDMIEVTNSFVFKKQYALQNAKNNGIRVLSIITRMQCSSVEKYRDEMEVVGCQKQTLRCQQCQ